ncbi:MAG: DUF3368 domain-containing protein [Acidobacteriales bacterium]|nr:DUF3368 domain-containing protein [Terriglobales bacterium]
MLVVADTSPLNYLIQVDVISILEPLFNRVVIPSSVLAELSDQASPQAVKDWLTTLPEWVAIQSASPASDAALHLLGPGEAEAIQLAIELHADLLLIDERVGTHEASARGLRTTGTLGVILRGADRGLLDPKAVLAKLAKTNFRMSRKLRQELLGY